MTIAATDDHQRKADTEIRRYLRLFARLGIALALLFAVSHLIAAWVATLDLTAESLAHIHRGMWATAAIYAGLLAIPFVPGVELGIGLMAMLGKMSAGPVYLATVAGLTLAYGAGRLLPVQVLIRMAAALGAVRIAALLRHVAPMRQEERVAFLSHYAPRGWGPTLLRHRYVALALLLNLPGNALIGGGGGIALIAGLSRLFPPGAFLLTIMLAVSPVPLLVWIFGADILATIEP